MSDVLVVTWFQQQNGLGLRNTDQSKERYAKTRDRFWAILKARYQGHLSVFWFQQDGALLMFKA